MEMKKRISLLTLFILLTFTTACGLQNIDDVPEEVVDAVEDMRDEVKENIKDTVNTTENVSQSGNNTTSPSEKITEDEAEAIAIKHAGFTADQVNRLRTEYEVDDGIPEYEVQFYYENMEYDYIIHAETGEILTYDWDND